MKRAKGNGEFASVTIRLEPSERGCGIEFKNQVVGGSIPKEFIPAVEKGIRRAVASGPIGSYPVDDLTVTLIGGAYHEQDSSGYAFEIASERAMNLAMREAGPQLLEPIMFADITVPHEFVGTIMSDIGRMTGKVISIDATEDAQTIRAEVPMRQTFGYITRLRSGTKGMGTCSLEFSRFDFAPIEIKERIEAGHLA